MRYDRHRLAIQKTESFFSSPLGRLNAEFREQLILEHLHEVKAIARRIHERLSVSVAFDDLISAGIVGLISAVDSYDASCEIKFQSYAGYRIRSAILNSLRGMKLGPQQHKRARLIEAAISVLENDEGHLATEEEIASRLHLSIEEYQAWLSDLSGLTLGTVENVGPHCDPLMLLVYQTDTDPQSLSLVAQRFGLERLVSDAIEKMPAIEQATLGHYYQEGLTLSEIAERLDLPESRVGQLKAQAIIRLRSYLTKRHLPSAENETHDRASVRPRPYDTEVTESRGTPGPVSFLIEDPTVGILMATAAAFQDLETGRSWLFTPSPALGNVAPMSLLSTEAGREIVANELGLIQHGMF